MLPIGTNITPRKTPYANYAFIAVNVVMFLLTVGSHQEIIAGQVIERVLRPWAVQFQLFPNALHLWQFVTYAFLHVSWMHIIGNMFFLYLFGKNVNDKMGNIGYVCFYLAAAVFSGIGHAIFSNAPVLGASGAVAAVTGAYLVLFPRSLITVVYWFFIIGTIEIQASLFIAIKLIILDNIIYADASNQIAYGAHLAGYAFGIVTILLLLSTKLLHTEQTTLWMIIKQWNRRRLFRDAAPSRLPNQKTKWVKAEIKKTPAQVTRDGEIAAIRTRITKCLSQHDLADAALTYIELMKIDDTQVLPRQQQLDIANQLMSSGNWQQSANAYEKFMKQYGNSQHHEQVELMLGILYARYLNESEKAIEYLNRARKAIADPGQVKMCEEELRKLGYNGH